MATNNQINSPQPFSLAIGGTGAVLTAIAGGVLYSGASVMAITAAGTAGDFFVSTGATAPIWKAVPGLITTWTTVVAATLAAALNNGYVINDGAAVCVVTLPAVAPVGSKISLRGISTGMGWTATANTGQTIQFGNQVSSAAGSWGTIVPTDSCDIECIVENTKWTITNCVSAGLTVV